MARLTGIQRHRIPLSKFAVKKGRKYPIEDESHARNALSRVSGNGTPEQKAEVRSAVARRFPNIKQSR
jgi:hypothetical protein